jgi:hypothetical protein
VSSLEPPWRGARAVRAADEDDQIVGIQLHPSTQC